MALTLIDEETLHWNLLTGVWTPGRVFYVDSSGSDTTGDGFSPRTPLKTINGAMDLCTANQGDVIQVMGNSSSSPNDTATITCDVAGVTIRGLMGRGLLSDSGFGSPTINVPVLTISASFVTIENLYLGTKSTGSTGGIVEFGAASDAVTFRNCLFDTQYVSAYGIYTPLETDLPYLLVEDCTFGFAGTAGYTTACIDLFNCSGGIIRRNIFQGYAGIGINLPATCGNLSILDNEFRMPSDTDGKAITLADGSSGIFIDGNHAAFGTADPADPYRDLNGDDDSNAWGLNYKGVTATLPKLT